MPVAHLRARPMLLLLLLLLVPAASKQSKLSTNH
jgi:hypothetical protein